MITERSNEMPYNALGHSKHKKYYRSVFLSDFHMGAKSFDAAALVKFLRSLDCEYLYLVGDVIDGWKLNKRWYWNEDCNQVIDELVKKKQRGTKIMYLPGNHDEELRRFNPLARREFAHRLGIRIREKTIHYLNDGRRFLIMHGDQFDRAILRGPLSLWSDRLYDWFMDIFEKSGPKIKIKGQLKPFSLAKTLSKHGQWALRLLNNFEHNIYKCAKRYDVDGMICGHTHIPTIKAIKDITYANSGCWLRTGHTALVEDENGELSLIDWPCSMSPQCLFDPVMQDAMPGITFLKPAGRERHLTNKIVNVIQDTWPHKILPDQKTTQWVEIHGRDHVTLERNPAFGAYNILEHKRPINLATKIFLRSSTVT